jgi:hypothetical protein
MGTAGARGNDHLGYPPYFITILGIWKVLGAAVILLSGFALVKEWAYAGMILDLTGATASHVAVGDDMRHVVVPLVLAALVVASWRPFAPRAGSSSGPEPRAQNNGAPRPIRTGVGSRLVASHVLPGSAPRAPDVVPAQFVIPRRHR